jgi:divalent metal cation (Fe/Co/Zn/Cd) transporter
VTVRKLQRMPDDNRLALLDRALRLSYISIGFGLLSGAVSVGSGLADASLGVLASGLSMLADVTGSIVLVWRFRVERTDPVRAEHVEQRAAKVIITALVLIALLLAYESISALIKQTHPESGVLPIISAGVSTVVLYPLAFAKRRTAAELDSHALKGDSTLSLIGATTALLALIGIVLFNLFGWWWADRTVALVVAALAALEARTLILASRDE